MRYRIALVEYLNTLPFTHGIRMTGLDKYMDMYFGPPGYCADMYQQGLVDIALCPIGGLADLPDFKIFSQYCIGANDAVRTVVLHSKVPLERIEKVRLDDHSRTSNLLLHILAKNYWKKEWVTYVDDDDFPESAVMIGDKVFQYESSYPYSYDLAEVWKKFSGFPMVFAVWISRPEVPSQLLEQLENAFATGINWISEAGNGLPEEKREYLLNSINFHFDTGKQESLKLYSKYLPELSTQISKNTTQI